MINLTIIGNLTADPVSRTTQNGKTVCSFTVACNYGYGDKQTTTFVRCSAWEKNAENCQRYLAKGRKVAVYAYNVNATAYKGNDGKDRAILEAMANRVEFLSPWENTQLSGGMYTQPTIPHGMTQIDDEELPF